MSSGSVTVTGPAVLEEPVLVQIEVQEPLEESAASTVYVNAGSAMQVNVRVKCWPSAVFPSTPTGLGSG